MSIMSSPMRDGEFEQLMSKRPGQKPSSPKFANISRTADPILMNDSLLESSESPLSNARKIKSVRCLDVENGAMFVNRLPSKPQKLSI